MGRDPYLSAVFRGPGPGHQGLATASCPFRDGHGSGATNPYSHNDGPGYATRGDKHGHAEVVGVQRRHGASSDPCASLRPGLAALAYTVRKVNFRQATQKENATVYGVSEGALRSPHQDLIETLDIMPCDCRYFRGEKNPLDMLVQATVMLDELEKQFRET